ncbi:MAG: hypothetical protein LBJ48_00565 [Coriobacteriales bacterium]|jgi:hypothetical protein|nr:hypothetical protein [Coriobacteriales bacterium]
MPKKQGSEMMNMTPDKSNDTEAVPEITTDAVSPADPVSSTDSLTEDTGLLKHISRRRFAVTLGSAGVLTTAAVATGVILTTTPPGEIIGDGDASLSALSSGTASQGTGLTSTGSSGTASFGSSSSGSSSDSITGGNSRSDGSNNSGSNGTGANSGTGSSGTTGNSSTNGSGGSPSGSNGNNSNSGNSGNNGSGNSGGNGGSDSGGNNSGNSGNSGSKKVWHEPWDEQVWVDTSSWQSVYVGENPIYEHHLVCNDCKIIVDGFGDRHILDTGHSGFHSETIFARYEPVYEDQYIESGYTKTIHHEGYWS